MINCSLIMWIRSLFLLSCLYLEYIYSKLWDVAVTTFYHPHQVTIWFKLKGCISFSYFLVPVWEKAVPGMTQTYIYNNHVSRHIVLQAILYNNMTTKQHVTKKSKRISTLPPKKTPKNNKTTIPVKTWTNGDITVRSYMWCHCELNM